MVGHSVADGRGLDGSCGSDVGGGSVFLDVVRWFRW